jgi:hypothetical protein
VANIERCAVMAEQALDRWRDEFISGGKQALCRANALQAKVSAASGGVLMN